jgi:hypothetical protein
MMQREIKSLCYKMQQGIKSPQHNITGSYDALLPNTAGSQVKKFGRLTRPFKELSCKISHTSVSILKRITYLNSPSLQFFLTPWWKNQRSVKHQVQILWIWNPPNRNNFSVSTRPSWNLSVKKAIENPALQCL